ncbi:MAG: hypothetical protein HYW89_01155 [Candidatus Sungiibacteriota bacterium]|uniref:Uncharacterized protein n=1 Tax=Candidatus Sungiibacteriota bacterium TaxID=2750080 RepID=A0A7T5UQ70_9BACT|nr:MAG: hypothetical protein HYW89_01155 [Candidatus Sungbacteria bacterium]
MIRLKTGTKQKDNEQSTLWPRIKKFFLQLGKRDGAAPFISIVALAVLALFSLFLGVLHAKEECRGQPQILCGSDKSLAWQNEVADFYELPRVKDLKMLAALVQKGVFIRIPLWDRGFYLEGKTLRPFALPFTKAFMDDLAGRFFAESSGKSLKITSIVRTEKDQVRLLRRKISDADGKTPERRSVHTTGAAFDISKLPMSEGEVRWLRRVLVALEEELGVIEATEEMLNNAFHIMVFPWYNAEAWTIELVSLDKNSNKKQVPKISKKKIKKKKPRR